MFSRVLSPEESAKNLRKAMKGIGTDENKVNKSLNPILIELLAP